MRFLADIPDDDVKWLDRLAAETGKSRAALLREAVSLFRHASGKEGIEQFFGLWASTEDGVAFQRRVRRNWDRRT